MAYMKHMDKLDKPMNTSMDGIRERIADMPPDTKDKYVLQEFYNKRKREKERKIINKIKK